MRERGEGRIVNIASVAGKEGNANAGPYSAAKAGVIALTKSLGKELATSGVLVNCITPAMADTELLREMTPEYIEEISARIPMGRLCRVEEGRGDGHVPERPRMHVHHRRCVRPDRRALGVLTFGRPAPDSWLVTGRPRRGSTTVPGAEVPLSWACPKGRPGPSWPGAVSSMRSTPPSSAPPRPCPRAIRPARRPPWIR